MAHKDDEDERRRKRFEAKRKGRPPRRQKPKRKPPKAQRPKGKAKAKGKFKPKGKPKGKPEPATYQNTAEKPSGQKPKPSSAPVAQRGQYTGGGPGFGPQTQQGPGGTTSTGPGKPKPQQINQGASSVTGSPPSSAGSNKPGPSGANLTSSAPTSSGSSGPSKASLRKQRRQHRAHMQKVRAVEAAVKRATTDSPEEREQKEKLDRLLKDPKARRPPKKSTAEKLGEKAPEIAANPTKAAARALGTKPKTLEKASKRFVRAVGDIRKQAAKQAKGEPKVRRQVRKAKRAWNKAGPNDAPYAKTKRQKALQKQGLSPSESRYTIETRISKKRHARKETKRFLRTRKEGREHLGHEFKVYTRAAKAAEAAPALARKRKAMNRPLREREVQKTARDAFREERKPLQESRRWKAKFGAVPEEGDKFWQQVRLAAESAPGKKTRREAKAILAREREIKEDINRGKIRHSDGERKILTPKARETGQQARKLAAFKERTTAPGPVKQLGKVYESVKQIPTGVADAVNAGWELYTKGDSEGFEKMWKGFKEGDPAYGAFAAIAEGRSLGEALDEAGDRTRDNPLAAIGDATIAGAAGAKIAGRAAHGSAAPSVRAARPNLKVDDRKAQAKFKEKGPVGRVRESQRRRSEARDRQVGRSKEAKAQARAQGGKRGEHMRVERAGKGEQRQFYSQSTPIRAFQKGKETVAALRGKDPFNATGKRADKIFAKRTDIARRRHSPANLALGATVISDLAETALKTDRKRFTPRNKLKTAAFELRFDNTIRRGRVREDLNAYLQAQRKMRDEGDPTGVHASNIAVAEKLWADYKKRGDKSLLGDEKIGERVERLRQTSRDLDDALVKAGYITEAVAARRRELGGAVARDDVAFKRKGDELGDGTKAPEEGFYAADGTPFRGTDGDGAYVDYRAVQERSIRGDDSEQMELAGEVVGQLRSSDLVHKRKLGEEHVRASMERRVKTLGGVRLRSELMEISPVKGRMKQAEAVRLLDELNADPKGSQYVMVASGKGGSGKDSGAPAFGRAPREGEQVYVVPKAIAEMHERMTKPAGRLRAGLEYANQKFVSAVLPFSTTWHAGNQIDLITRLAVAGANPFRDPELGRLLREAMERKDANTANETFAWTQGHFGSRQSVLAEANLAKALAPAKSRLGRSAGELATRMHRNRGLQVAMPLRFTAQKGFDVATRLEKPWVAMARGRAAKKLAEDLGIAVRDHAKLAQRLADELDADPALIEEFGRRTLEIIGDYSTSPFAQQVLQNIDPFFTWMRESTRFVFKTFPVGHPVRFALFAQAANLSYDAAEQLGLHEFGEGLVEDMEGFLASGVPVPGMDGWARPTSPFTSWGETARLLDDPWSYFASRPMPWGQQVVPALTGNMFYYSGGELLLRELVNGDILKQLGIDVELPNVTLPGFDQPQNLPITQYTGDRSDAVLGELLESFVPGASALYTARVGGFPTGESNFFNPEARKGTEVPWYENRALNPFGRVRDLGSLGSEKKGKAKDEPTKREKRIERHQLEKGALIYGTDGERLRWNGKEFVAAGNPRGRHDGTRTGKGKDAPKPSRARKAAAVRQLQSEFPEIGEHYPEAYNAIAAASRKYDVPPEVLAGIYSIETGFGRLNQVTSSAGAQGQMQFMPATWDAYGVDATGDGKADPYNVHDAMHSAANYLKASGAETDLRGAIFAYNHADWYVDDVLSRAEQFRSKAWRQLGTGAAHRVNRQPQGPPKRALEKWVVRVEGDEDIKNLSPGLQAALVKLGKKSGIPVRVNSGNRSRAEQAELYAAFQAGTGNLAAPPGQSNHEHGQAADVDLQGNQAALLAEVGLHQPVSGEPWHLELIDPGGWEPSGGGGGGGFPSLPSSGGQSTTAVTPTAAVGAVPAHPKGSDPAVFRDPVRAAQRREMKRGLMMWRAELVMSFLNDEISATELVLGLTR